MSAKILSHLADESRPGPISSVHGPFYPQDVWQNQGISAKLTMETSGLEISYPVWRISPLGVELLDNKSNFSGFKGSRVNLRIHVGDQVSRLEGVVVDEILDVDVDKKLICIRLTSPDTPREEGQNRRQTNRWMCSEQFYPTAVAGNPARYNDFMYFRVKDVSKSGLRLATSLRNKFLIRGMVLDCLVNFPMVSQVRLKVKVQNVSIALEEGKEILSLGVSFDPTSDKTAEVISQYVFQFGDISSPQELSKEGLSLRTTTDVVDFGFVRTRDEYQKVLELRYLCYKTAGKLGPDAKVQDMADSFDSRSRIVIGRYRGEIVACARLTFNEFDERMEQETYLDWPTELPRRDEMVEIMRACNRPDFKGTDLLLSMFRFIALTVVQSKRPWIVLCATDEMTPLYQRIGFSHVGLSYEHPKLNHLRHNIMLAHVPNAMGGKGVNPLDWNIIWNEVSSYMDNYDLLELDTASQLRMSIYRLFKPLAYLVYGWKKKKQRRMLDSLRTLAPGGKAA